MEARHDQGSGTAGQVNPLTLCHLLNTPRVRRAADVTVSGYRLTLIADANAEAKTASLHPAQST